MSVLAVIASHAGTAALGGLGVNTFFVLSGFLITWLLLNEWNKYNTISIRRFYTRRMLRIFPAYYFFIFVTVTADLLLGNDEIKPAILPALTYTTNYFNIIYDHPGLSVAHAWSLAIEEQFYLLWPAILLIILKNNNRLLIPLLVTIIVSSMAWRSIAYTSLQFGTSYIYDAFETRVDSLASGCLLAAMLQRKRVRDLVDISTTLPLLSVLAFILMLLLHLGGTPFYRYTIGYTVSSLLAAFLITQLMTLSIRGPWRILEYAPVRYLGIISYPIYLWHARCLELASKAGLTEPWQMLLAGTLISIVVASGSYYIIERPFLLLKKRFASKQITLPGMDNAV